MKDQEKDTGGVPPLLELRQVSRTFTVRDHAFGETRKLRAVSDVDLRLNRGDCLGLVGESGCGKSTLGRLACGLIPPTSGQILYRGTPLPPAGPHSSVAGRLQMVFQDPYSSLNPRLRVGRSVSEGLLAACSSACRHSWMASSPVPLTPALSCSARRLQITVLSPTPQPNLPTGQLWKGSLP